MTQHTIVITDSDLPGAGAERALADAGHRVVNANSSEPRDILAAGSEATGLVVQWATISSDIMAALPNLRVISRLGIGYDMVDVAAASELGIAVTNTPAYCVEEVAGHTLAMIMSLSRGLPGYDAAIRGGDWAPTAGHPMVARPSTTSVAIVGYGRIGALVAKHCASIGFRVLVADPFIDPQHIRAAGLLPTELDDAITQADILSLHVPLVPETHHLINAEALAAMRPGAVVVNTCRGPLIDEEALAGSLRSSHTGAAALDVFENEPLRTDSPLRDAPNLLLSPHAAWYSPEALADLPLHAARNVNEFLAGRPVAEIVNPDYASRGAKDGRIPRKLDQH